MPRRGSRRRGRAPTRRSAPPATAGREADLRRSPLALAGGEPAAEPLHRRTPRGGGEVVVAGIPDVADPLSCAEGPVDAVHLRVVLLLEGPPLAHGLSHPERPRGD